MMRIQWVCWFSLVSSAFPTDLGDNSAVNRPKMDHNCFWCLGPTDCSCNVDTVDHFNNVKLFPRLESLLRRDYFRFYRINLRKSCPFWADDDSCLMPSCNVEMCLQDDVPPGLRNSKVGDQNSRKELCRDKDLDPILGNVNTTSVNTYDGFELWTAYDVERFAEPEEHADAGFVDLVSNPERYTGYEGSSANRIWKAIYHENCFWLNSIPPSEIEKVCLEKRMFYRVISGLHASISVHLSANYLFNKRNVGSLLLKRSEGGAWGPNPAEFSRRFSSKNTAGQGPNWIKNLYFVYLVELRALAKASPYLQNETFFTGNTISDEETKSAVLDILKVVKSFGHHLNESALFGGDGNSASLKKEFRQRFANVTRIMDCVGCEKCKLWGKLQVRGLGTALNILFSGKFNHQDIASYPPDLGVSAPAKLSRGEIVSLFNGLGRLSYSIYEMEHLKRLVKPDKSQPRDNILYDNSAN